MIDEKDHYINLKNKHIQSIYFMGKGSRGATVFFDIDTVKEEIEIKITPGRKPDVDNRACIRVLDENGKEVYSQQLFKGSMKSVKDQNVTLPFKANYTLDIYYPQLISLMTSPNVYNDFNKKQLKRYTFTMTPVGIANQEMIEEHPDQWKAFQAKFADTFSNIPDAVESPAEPSAEPSIESSAESPIKPDPISQGSEMKNTLTNFTLYRCVGDVMATVDVDEKNKKVKVNILNDSGYESDCSNTLFARIKVTDVEGNNIFDEGIYGGKANLRENTLEFGDGYKLHIFLKELGNIDCKTDDNITLNLSENNHYFVMTKYGIENHYPVEGNYNGSDVAMIRQNISGFPGDETAPADSSANPSKENNQHNTIAPPSI
jgi:Putative mucin or carbohydrate-binding module